MTQPPTKHQNHRISADGKSAQPLGSPAHSNILEIIIDGNSLRGGKDSPTLLGSDNQYLPSSILYRLEHFEPQSDGTCLLRYRRQ